MEELLKDPQEQKEWEKKGLIRTTQEEKGLSEETKGLSEDLLEGINLTHLTRLQKTILSDTLIDLLIPLQDNKDQKFIDELILDFYNFGLEHKQYKA